MRVVLAVLSIGVALAACDHSAEREAQAKRDADWARQHAAEMSALDAKRVQPTRLSEEDAGRVCRAAIASLMGRDPRIIGVTSNDGHDVFVSYRRPNDGTLWRNHCAIDGDRVSWAAILDGQHGRWRSEDDIRYTLKGASVKVTVRSDGELMSEKTYQVD